MKRCKPRAMGIMKKANGSVLTQEYCCVEVERETGQRKWEEMGEGWGGEASCEVERDEKEVDGVGHAEGNEVDELKV